ncbi:MAG: MFS transporter [Candidatus Heimdallarchaeota archaeon]|nr:MFS transporter [Candidatus Heimdallarchaeota archaeon]
MANGKIYTLILSLQTIGERIIFSFVQLYADKIGASGTEQGVLLSLRNIISFSGQNYFGKASDRYGRISILLIGFLLSAISSFSFLKTITPITVILAFVLYSIGFSAIQPAFSALIGDTYPEHKRAEMLGKIGGIGGFIGASLFLVVGLISDTLLDPYQYLFIIAGCSFASAGFAVVFLHFRYFIPTVPHVRETKVSYFYPLSFGFFRKFVLMDALFALAMATSWPLFPRKTNELANTSQVTIMWSVTFISYSISARYTKQLKEKIGSYSKSLYYSRFLLFLVPLTFAFATSWLHLIPARFIAGITFGYYATIQKDYILESVAKIGKIEHRGLFLGTHAFMYGIFTFVGSIVFGKLVDVLIDLNTGMGYDEMFIVSAILRFFAGFLFLLVPDLMHKDFEI